MLTKHYLGCITLLRSSSFFLCLSLVASAANCWSSTGLGGVVMSRKHWKAWNRVHGGILTSSFQLLITPAQRGPHNHSQLQTNQIHEQRWSHHNHKQLREHQEIYHCVEAAGYLKAYIHHNTIHGAERWNRYCRLKSSLVI